MEMFLAKRYNLIANFGYCHTELVLSVIIIVIVVCRV